ncbi:type VI secretion system tube protein Hcp, partial [Escherichia coli]|uniref:type VI secretion system tube protein Hcp n=1 Tax=Escherichia coli TaxID=562 RepID=UPI0014854E07
DASSPYLYKAVTTGQTLKTARYQFYRINETGQEVEYIKNPLDHAKLSRVHPTSQDNKG